MPPAEPALLITTIREDPQEQKQLCQLLASLTLSLVFGWLYNQRETPMETSLLHELDMAFIALLFSLSLVLLAKLSFTAAKASEEKVLGCPTPYIHGTIYVFGVVVVMLKLSARVPLISFLRSSLVFLSLLFGVLGGPHLFNRTRCPSFIRHNFERFHRPTPIVSDAV